MEAALRSFPDFASGVSKMTAVTARSHSRSKRLVPSNNIKAEASALAQDIFLSEGALGQARESCKEGQDLLGEARVGEVRRLVTEAQHASWLTIEPLLKAHALLLELPEGLHNVPSGVSLRDEQQKLSAMGQLALRATLGQEAEEARVAFERQEVFVGEVLQYEADQEKLRRARSALRDAIVYFMVPQMLGLDSKREFVNVLRTMCSSDEGGAMFSSQMQNAYRKLLGGMQEWVEKTDVRSGMPRMASPSSGVDYGEARRDRCADEALQSDPDAKGQPRRRRQSHDAFRAVGDHLKEAVCEAARVAWQWQFLGTPRVELAENSYATEAEEGGAAIPPAGGEVPRRRNRMGLRQRRRKMAARFAAAQREGSGQSGIQAESEE